MTIRVALVGCGGWGKNLLRVLAAHPRARVVAVADPDPEVPALVARIASGAPVVPSLDTALDLGPDAVVIATPSKSHAALAEQALDAGVDVFVEKPLALTAADAERCASLAKARGRVAMVGHLLRYHPTLVHLIALARSGAFGRLLRVESERLSARSSELTAALWTLGPHDLSVLFAIDPSHVESVDVSPPLSDDHASFLLRLASGLTARVLLSRAHPNKERRIHVIGEDAVASVDDVRAPDRIVVSASGRRSEILVPWEEPLRLEVDHFLECVETRGEPRTSFDEGARVVEILSRTERAGERTRASSEPVVALRA